MTESTQVMIMADLHFALKEHRGIFEGGAFKWLIHIIKRFKPDVLILLGDMDWGWTFEDWTELTELVTVHAIYGNHDNLHLLNQIKNKDGTWMLKKDGERLTINGFTFGFLNGIVSRTKRIKDGIPRQTPEMYLVKGKALKGVDILCTHESPWIEEYGNYYHRSRDDSGEVFGIDILRDIIEEIQPIYSFGGHLSGAYSIGQINRTIAVKIDASPKEQHFAILSLTDEHNFLQSILKIFNDGTEIELTSFHSITIT